ncbi:MAG: dTDP-4-amino-4,6-dideoxygalactose transaminase [Thermomicrobiales bacterium]
MSAPVPVLRYPFNRACLPDASRDYLLQAAAGVISGDGPFGKRCEAWLESALGCPRALLTTSCTHALEMAALLLGIGPGDEVILPSFTFVSAANAVVLRGARPVFVDIRRDTLNLDERQIEQAITPRTRAIMVVHYAGVACDMDAIGEIAARHGLPVIEDNAHGLFGGWRGRPLGAFGALSTASFHETKNLTCGEGGALIVNDPALIERAEIIREKGTDRSRFFRGQVDKYSWVDAGSSYVISDLLAAVLLGQLEEHERIQTGRERIWQRYAAELAGWAEAQGVGLPVMPEGADPAWHQFYLIMPSLADRQAFIAHLRQRGIMAVFHYLPLHLSIMGRNLGGAPGDCRVTEEMSDRLVRLPLYLDLEDVDLDAIIEVITDWRPTG